MLKEEVRLLMRHRRAAEDGDTRRQAAAAITAAIMARREYITARVISFYLSLPLEIDTTALITITQDSGRQVAVPAWNKALRAYELVLFPPGGVLLPGPQGILEPAAGETITPAAVSLAIVPGLAFDRYGGRLGYGGGHFDRLLASMSPSCVKAGVARAWQVLADPLPLEPHDVRMNMIVTEQEIVAPTELL